MVTDARGGAPVVQRLRQELGRDEVVDSAGGT